jgi:transposase
MPKTFREWTPEQNMMLPPSVMDWVPAGHLVHFVLNLIREDLDLREILSRYQEERGYPPFHPAMMVGLLLYAYSQGIYSSRRIARACQERLDFMALTAMQQPDFRTISLFRLRHLEQLKGLFGQVLKLCGKAGLVKLGHVALDGTRMRANASKNKSMSYGRMKRKEEELKQEIESWFRQAEQLDNKEDEVYGSDRRGDELPEWVTDKQKRLERIRQAKAELEAEAKAAAEASPDPAKTRHEAKPTGVPAEKSQRNFTDADSRIMKSHDGFIQGYNCQAAVDADHQIIVAEHVTSNGSDMHQMVRLLDQIPDQLKRQAKELSADAGYCSEHNLKELVRRRIRGYVASRWKSDSRDQSKDRRPPDKIGPYGRRMWQRLRQGAHRSRYRLRKQVVEPVFGHIKQARGFRQFLLRSKTKVSGEWSLLCTVHNLLKLAAAGA